MSDESRLDLGALERFLDAKGVPGEGEPIRVEPVGGGASNEIFDLRRGDARLVLRKPPRRVPKGRNQAMLREYRVLAALADSDVPHPRAVAVCEDEAVLGSCFYLMEHVDGWSPMQLDGAWPAPFDTDLDARRRLAFELVDGIAALATLDWRAAGLEGFGKPEGFLERQVDRWLHHLSGFSFRDLPGLDAAADWLRAHTPARFTPGILHGDYQFANVMFRHGAPARLAAIVDWEMATVGDPLLDLAWVLMSWPDPEERGASSRMRYVDYEGMPIRAELAERYAARSGLPIDALDYYVVLARFKMAIVLEGGYARFVAGESDNPKTGQFGDIVLDMARQAAELAADSPL